MKEREPNQTPEEFVSSLIGEGLEALIEFPKSFSCILLTMEGDNEENTLIRKAITRYIDSNRDRTYPIRSFAKDVTAVQRPGVSNSKMVREVTINPVIIDCISFDIEEDLVRNVVNGRSQPFSFVTYSLINDERFEAAASARDRNDGLFEKLFPQLPTKDLKRE